MKRYDLVIIGGGVAGLIAASGGARFGASVALIEKKSLGGDCLNFGCVPTKRLIYSARVAHLARRAQEFGIVTGEVVVDFKAVMEGVASVQAEIGRKDSAERFSSMGVTVVSGEGRFLDNHTFEVEGQRLEGKRFLIATGSHPFMPEIKGLREAVAITNEGALTLKALPASIIILGGGPIGIEFGQAFARLGSKVTVIERRDRILAREDPELTTNLVEMLRKEGVEVELSAEVAAVVASGQFKTVAVNSAGVEKTFTAEVVMVASGRTPNVEGLGLSEAGVEYDPVRGIAVNEKLQTSRDNIYAAGDCIGKYAFTHVAEHQASVAVGNALFPFIKRKVDYSVVPWATFTDPELARAGLLEEEARAIYGGDNVVIYRHAFKDVDRAVMEGVGSGLIKLVCSRSGLILGAHILGPAAGELIHEYVLAMKKGLKVSDISRTIHVYPTLSMGVKRAADEYYIKRLFSGAAARLARRVIRLGL